MEDSLKCPKCGSSQTRYRILTKERICYVCGNHWKVEPQQEKKI